MSVDPTVMSMSIDPNEIQLSVLFPDGSDIDRYSSISLAAALSDKLQELMKKSGWKPSSGKLILSVHVDESTI